jgi:hypothetical protein
MAANTLEVLNQLERGDLSAASALSRIRGETVVESGGAPNGAVRSRRERLRIQAERVGDWDPQQMAAPAATAPHFWP